MAIYTLSMNYIDGVSKNQSHLHNVFLKFSNPDCEHKAAMDKSKKLWEIYSLAASTNVDLQTWLDWMTRTKETCFEFIDVNIPPNLEEEEVYLMVASATKSYQKIIVDTHQCWEKFNYESNCNKIIYKKTPITVLDRNEAFKELNESNNISINVTNETAMNKNNPWQSGSFYLFAFLLVILTLSVASFYLPIYVLPITFIAAILALSILGALQLRNDSRLSDKSFISLMGIALKQLPFLKKTENKEDKK